MAVKSWIITAALVAAIVIIAVIVLTRGSSTFIAPTSPPPVLARPEISVSPGFPGGVPISAWTSACGVPTADSSHQAVNESPVVVQLTLPPGSTVTGTSLELTDRQTVSAGVSMACAGIEPRYTGIPSGYHVVRLPAHGSAVSLSAFNPGKRYLMLVQPPPGKRSADVNYVWKIKVTYKWQSESTAGFSALFATLAIA
jgi:hypothetical protein